ncbi:DUF3842 family protein [Pseudobacteroides cellulosolvens]|uniref:DUF3842 family protein n=1 Tax=Pseudobacteroides cellulosolvens TaxID=35825 RepID=UPI00056986AE|nr:DUF3842 family protein [Pseudobacteroides cellulosolvens]
MRVAVIDGQGGGMGKAIVEKLRIVFENHIEILALGTNALAASLMLKAGADECASGENSIVFCSSKVDVIIGPIGIIAANSMLGELTPNMAKAIAESGARKILIPMNKCNIQIACVRNEPLLQQIDDAIEILKGFN